MKGKKSLSGIALLVVVAIGAYLFGGMDLVYEVLGIDEEAPVINVDLLEVEVEPHYVYDLDNIICEDNIDGECIVSIIGDFDTDSLGEHTVVLFAKDEAGNETSVQFNYTVSDTTAATIDVSLLDETVEPYHVFDLDDITCEDDFDEECNVTIVGDFNTDTLGEHSVSLSTEDESGNTTSIDFVYSVIDNTDPVLDLTNVSNSVQLNEELLMNPTCTDNFDVSCEVVISTIDTSVLGEFTVTLTATDSSGNVATIDLTYHVLEGVNTTMYTPDGYYNGIDGLVGQDLITALNLIITNHTEYPYTHSNTDVWDILREADEDPNNSDNIIMFYTGVSHPKDCQDTVTPPAFCEVTVYDEAKLTEWNREHIWSKSRGEFDTSSMTAHNDTHHLVAAERAMNSTKNNRFFEDCHDGDDTNIVDRGYGNYTCNEWEFEPRDEVKGDVARMLFYMAVRYEGSALYDDGINLVLMDDPVEDKSLKLPVYGDLDDLLRWHLEDPVDQWEIDRNEVIYSYQGNRNPFIELPDLVELIWGTSEDYN